MQLRFESLVLLAYDAPLRRARWSPFLRALADVTDARATGIKWVLPQGCAFRAAIFDFGGDIERAYVSHFGAVDVWARASLSLPQGADLFGDEWVRRSDLKKSEFYADFCKPYGVHDVHKNVIVRSAALHVSLGILKPTYRLADPRERRLTQRLSPHLRRAVLLDRRIGTLLRSRDALTDTLDLFPSAVFLLDARGHVVHCNRAARALLDAHDGLTVRGRTLEASCPDDTNALRAHVTTAIAVARGRPDGLTASPCVAIRRPSGKPAFEAVASPLHPRHDDLVRRSIDTLLVVTQDPRQAPADALARLYKLTAAETRVAMSLACGQSRRQIADELAITANTVRTHCSNIYAKTGLARQSSLMHLLAHLDESRATAVPAESNGGSEPPRTPAAVRLTDREREVLRLALAGCENKVIAFDLGVAHSTVKALLARTAMKLGVRSRIELLARAATLDLGPARPPTSGHT
jgi:DNA-binding NarL/FixJ family response regulator